MGRPLKIKKSSTVDIGFNNPAIDHFGVVGGDTSLSTASHPVTRVRVKIGSNSEADGHIIRQKGASKYLVTDGANTGTCALVDESDTNLTADTMTVTVRLDDSSEVRLKRFTNRWGLDFSDTRYLLNFFVTSDDDVVKSGFANNGTVDLVIVDNPSTY